MNEWELTRALKKRVIDAGLECRLLKLIPHADKIIEAEDECEFPSGHMVSLLAIGARPTLTLTRARTRARARARARTRTRTLTRTLTLALALTQARALTR